MEARRAALQERAQAFLAVLAALVGHPEWTDDPRLATRQGWADHLETVLRPAIEAWACAMTKAEACQQLAAAGIAAGPCLSDAEVVHDPHVAARSMLVELPRPDGVAQPVLVPASPVRLSGAAPSAEIRPPWLGEHTDEVLGTELGLAPAALAQLRADGVIS